MKIDHIGYITGDIEASSVAFSSLGYVKGETFFDEIQKCYICFLCNGDDKIELVQPYEDNVPMSKMLKKRGVSPYHVCYEVQDVQRVYDSLSQKEDWTPMFAPVKAVAFGNRMITYFLNPECGYIEFVNAK